MRDVCALYEHFWHIKPKYKSTSNTGEREFEAPICPACGAGKDRFVLWPDRPRTDGLYQGGYTWCRQCRKYFDPIGLYRAATGAGYREACEALKLPLSQTAGYKRPHVAYAPPRERPLPKEAWQARARAFVSYCLGCREGSFFYWLKGRHLTKETADRFSLGYNPKHISESAELWGLPAHNEDGTPNLVHLPRGYVIPQIFDNEVQCISIRRENWDPKSKYGKYQQVKGGYTGPHIVGESRRPVVIVEGALDAFLIFQEAGDIVASMALKSAATAPDRRAHNFLSEARVSLAAMDKDKAGENGAKKLEKNYKAKFLPMLFAKDPTELAAKGLDLRVWILKGLKLAGCTFPDSLKDAPAALSPEPPADCQTPQDAPVADNAGQGAQDVAPVPAPAAVKPGPVAGQADANTLLAALDLTAVPMPGERPGYKRASRPEKAPDNPPEGLTLQRRENTQAEREGLQTASTIDFEPPAPAPASLPCNDRPQDPLPLWLACQIYGYTLPISQTELCGLKSKQIGGCIRSVWLSGTLTCEACRFWTDTCVKLAGVFQPRPACPHFVARADVLIMTVRPGDIRDTD